MIPRFIPPDWLIYLFIASSVFVLAALLFTVWDASPT